VPVAFSAVSAFGSFEVEVAELASADFASPDVGFTSSDFAATSDFGLAAASATGAEGWPTPTVGSDARSPRMKL
jgi:hypothetical protein